MAHMRLRKVRCAAIFPRTLTYHGPMSRLRILMAATCWLLLTGTGGAAADNAPVPVYQVWIAQQPPPCSEPRGMPITPNDPGALTTPDGRRCYGTRPPRLELWLPRNRYVWVERGSPNPAAWIRVGPLLVDLRGLQEAPLGLRLTGSRDTLALETRYAESAVLTRLEPGRWQEITAADGSRFWVHLPADGDGQAVSRSSAETATPLRSQ